MTFSPARFAVISLAASVALALDGLCAQSDSLAACHERVILDIYATVNDPLSVLAGPKPEQWADDVSGRISPLGTYDDYEGTKEYFYGVPCKLASDEATTTFSTRSFAEMVDESC